MIGSAVKASEFLMDHDKRYYAGIKLGITTDTQDITGNIITEHKGTLPSFEEFCEVAKSFEGEILQTPPMYSALNVGGVKLAETLVQQQSDSVAIPVDGLPHGSYIVTVKGHSGVQVYKIVL